MELPPFGPLATTLLSALVAGLARGFSGFGAALIFIPLASAAVGPRAAATLLLIVDNLTTLPLIPPAWRVAARREIAVMAAGALVGAPFGAALLLNLEPVLLRWGMCLLVAAMLVLLASGWRYHGKPRFELSLVIGAVSGFCSGAAQMGGPPVVAYWLGGAIPATRVRANIVLFFAITGLISAVVYGIGGLLNTQLLLVAALMAPIYGAGVWAGGRLFGFASEATFRRACFVLIGLAALLGLPLWDGLRR
ncbi:sulfite exporter TauE/SafE family protein [Roseomonas hellenica]|uniref:Probable membrane transporter protein n=1 Tax=Plastoroseomonas hellenica TaxID=2687306 RepID=A0ABS5EYH6_9PROT|nr:sulfite exporter TauE/SafE family protein [Plastoroseomonas hellenica]MBR0665338.1 sulfite exporter TauE/SafE family protein [Plastoroseomonas hellenica]